MWLLSRSSSGRFPVSRPAVELLSSGSGKSLCPGSGKSFSSGSGKSESAGSGKFSNKSLLESPQGKLWLRLKDLAQQQLRLFHEVSLQSFW